jgi:hypothetical protein
MGLSGVKDFQALPEMEIFERLFWGVWMANVIRVACGWLEGKEGGRII